MIALSVKLVLAHLLGDFVLQSDRAVKSIRKKRFRSPHFYLHGLIHYLLIVVLTGFELKFMLPALVLALAHLMIDAGIKFGFETDKNRIACFIADQALHMVTLAAFVNIFHPFKIQWDFISSTDTILFLTAVAGVTYVAAVVMKILLTPYAKRIDVRQGTQHAGKLIGMLERLFIFAFVLKGFWEGIGFLLAAKSIFRFGDLKESKDVKLTEYILIGTLLSFGIGIAVAEIYLFFRSLAS